MGKHTVHVAVNVTSFAAVEVEAPDEIAAHRIVAESIEKDGWESPYWQETADWETDWQNADDFRVVGWEDEP
jgi:hypothetical protein